MVAPIAAYSALNLAGNLCQPTAGVIVPLICGPLESVLSYSVMVPLDVLCT